VGCALASRTGLITITAVTARIHTSNRTTPIGPVPPAGLWLIASWTGPLTMWSPSHQTELAASTDVVDAAS
jgi:hypothetical protein